MGAQGTRLARRPLAVGCCFLASAGGDVAGGSRALLPFQMRPAWSLRAVVESAGDRPWKCAQAKSSSGPRDKVWRRRRAPIERRDRAPEMCALPGLACPLRCWVSVIEIACPGAAGAHFAVFQEGLGGSVSCQCKAVLARLGSASSGWLGWMLLTAPACHRRLLSVCSGQCRTAPGASKPGSLAGRPCSSSC